MAASLSQLSLNVWSKPPAGEARFFWPLSLPNTENTCQQEHTAPGELGQSLGSWIWRGLQTGNALQPRQSCRQPRELSHFPLLLWPGTCGLGWLACFLISDLGPPTHASEHRGCLGVGEGRVKIIPYSCFREVRLVPFLCGHFIES